MVTSTPSQGTNPQEAVGGAGDLYTEKHDHIIDQRTVRSTSLSTSASQRHSYTKFERTFNLGQTMCDIDGLDISGEGGSMENGRISQQYLQTTIGAGRPMQMHESGQLETENPVVIGLQTMNLTGEMEDGQQKSPSKKEEEKAAGNTTEEGAIKTRRVLGMDEPTAIAAALIAMSALMYSLQAVNVKLLGEDVGYWTISVWRGGVGLISCVISYHASPRVEGSNPWGSPENRSILIIRGAYGAASVISSFAALTSMDIADTTCVFSTAPLWTALMALLMDQSMDMADATCIFSTAPLWTALMAVLMDKGRWTKYDTLASICCTVGVILVLKPGPIFGSAYDHPGRNTAFGVISAIVSAITTAAFTIATRWIQKENTSVVAGYAMVLCILMALPGMIYEQITRRGVHMVHGWAYDIVQLLLTGLFSYAAHMSKTYAMQITRNIGVVVMRYLNILFAFAFEATLLQESVDTMEALGAFIIVAGCLVSVLCSPGDGH